MNNEIRYQGKPENLAPLSYTLKDSTVWLEATGDTFRVCNRKHNRDSDTYQDTFVKENLSWDEAEKTFDNYVDWGKGP
jgi:hypothetical protein